MVNKQVNSLREKGDTSDDLYSIALGPNNQVRSYTGCIINGLRFHTIERDSRRTTQNSGVMVPGEESEGDEMNFYGVLDEVLDLEYARRRRVIVFKCRWFDTDVKKNRTHVHLGFRSIDVSRYWYVDDPFILATQAQQVFYLDDHKLGGKWKVVQIVQNKRLWDVPENGDVENDLIELDEVARGILVDEVIQEHSLCRDDVHPTFVERPIRQQTNRSTPQITDDEFINDEPDDVEISTGNSSSSHERLLSDNQESE